MFGKRLKRLVQGAALLCALLCALLAAPAGARAQDPAASPWADAPKSRARLIAAGPLENGAYAAGVEIALTGQALTYWRTPGDAGVPPTFEFAASANLAGVDVIYPAPERHDEGGAQAFGWRKGVVFPLTVRPRDPARPVTLDLTLRYAACEAICVPSEGRMRLTLTPTARASAYGQVIAAWLARAPRPAAAAGLGFDLQSLAHAPKPTWTVRVTPSPGAGADLFAEGPDGFFFDTKAVGDAFELQLAERPSDAAGPVAVRLTLTRAQGAVERDVKLDAAGDPH